jgi:hypothetical protein
MSRASAILIAFFTVVALACGLMLAALNSADARPRHRAPPPRHARLVKHAATLDLKVLIPHWLLAPKPAANHHGQKRHRR